MNYEYIILPSGLRVVHRLSESPVSYCGFVVDCGTRDEADPAEYGMAHFCEHILFKGTSHRDSWHINQRIESVGGELNAFTTKEDTTFYSVFLGRDFNRACELLCDLVCHPTAPQHELEKEQEVVVDEIMSYQDTPSELVFDELENRLFQHNLLGHNILGSEETVRSFDSTRCRAFLSQHYRPERMVFFHVGSTPFAKVVKALERWYELQSSVPAGQGLWHREMSPDMGDNPFRGLTLSLQHETHQSHVAIGFQSLPIGDPSLLPLHLLNNILGGPFMNSRLNQELREKRGLVYTVESNVTSFTDTGYMSIYFGCDHYDVERCTKLVWRQLEHILSQPLTSRQLEAAKKQYKGQLGVSTASLENTAISLGKNLLRRGFSKSLEELCAEIDQITAADLQAVAQQILQPQQAVTVMIQ